VGKKIIIKKRLRKGQQNGGYCNNQKQRGGKSEDKENDKNGK